MSEGELYEKIKDVGKRKYSGDRFNPVMKIEIDSQDLLQVLDEAKQGFPITEWELEERTEKVKWFLKWFGESQK